MKIENSKKIEKEDGKRKKEKEKWKTENIIENIKN